jgi:hypothetical protein
MANGDLLRKSDILLVKGDLASFKSWFIRWLIIGSTIWTLVLVAITFFLTRP